MNKSTKVDKQVGGVATEFLDQCFATEGSTSQHESFEMTDKNSQPRIKLEELDEDNLIHSSHLVSASLAANSSLKSGDFIINNECIVVDLDEDDSNSSFNNLKTTRAKTANSTRANTISSSVKTDHKRNAFRHDPWINGVYVSRATVKYTVVTVATLGLVALLLFFAIIGFVLLNRCTVNQYLPVYLIVLGFSGLTRIILWSTCAYSFSKSILVKTYEHLVWRLVINRARASYYHACESSINKSVDDRSSDSNSSHSVSSQFKCNHKCSCFFSCLLNFFCCRCICLAREQKYLSKNNKKVINVTASTSPVVETSLVINKTDNSTTPRFELGPVVRQSYSNLSTAASTHSNQISDLNRIDTTPNPAELGHRKKKSESRVTRSRSANDDWHRSESSVKKQKHVEFDLRRKRADSTNYGHRYFYGQYGYNYGTHKRLHRHHNKMHRPLRLFDFRSVRYCIAFMLQRCMDVFMLVWFICGNYWLFSSSLDEAAHTCRGNSTCQNTR
jgi:hypothetical protein